MTFRNGFYSTLVAGSEVPYYTFSLTAGSQYQVLATPSAGVNVAMSFYFYDTLTSTWNLIKPLINNQLTGVAELDGFTAASNGTYSVDFYSVGSIPGNIWLDVFEGTGTQPTVTHDVLSTSAPLTSSIAASGNFGWYAIDLSSTNQYQFDLGVGASLDGQLWLYDANNNLLASADNGWASGLAETLFYTPPTTATYYLSVSGYDITTGNFTLTTTSSAIPTGDFVAGNNTTINSLPVNDTLWGKIDDALDTDWYSIALTSGLTYRFDLSEVSGLDGIMQFYDTDGIASLGEVNYGFAGDGESAYFTPGTSGTYYIAVDGFGTTTGEFYLTSTDVSGYTGADVPGSTTTSATLTQHVSGKIGDAATPSTDADWYAVNLTANTQYQFDLGSATLDGILALYDASGINQLAYVDSGWGTGLPEALLYTPTSNGTYYIGVSGYGGSSGDFLLDLATIGTGAGTDVAGNTTSTAVNLAVATNVREAVNSATDQDWYHVSLTAGTGYKFDLTSNVLDSTLTLYDGSGTLLDYRDYGYSGEPEQLIITPTVSGDYYISVGGSVSSTGDYDLSFNALGTSGGEIAGSISTTASLAIPGFASSAVDTATDSDWFSVRMDGGSEYRFDLYNSSNLDGILSVYDANGNPVLDAGGNPVYADNGWFTGDNEFLYFTPTTTDNYFIGVSSFGSTTGNYELYSSQTYDASQITWTDTTDYTDIKWNVLDWSVFSWTENATDVDWGDVVWTEITDYSSMDWDYIDWQEFDDSDYDVLNYEQVDWDELANSDWGIIDWTQILLSEDTWDHLQYEQEYDSTAPNYDTSRGWNINTSSDRNEGNDKIIGGAANDRALLGAGLDLFEGGEGADYVDGGKGADSLNGGGGSDTLKGGAGNDWMDGGSGSDTYYVDDAGDIVHEADNAASATPFGTQAAPDLGSKIDKVVASISYTLTEFIENLDLAASGGSLSGTGNTLANAINGNSKNNALAGLAGDDNLIGGAGDDNLVGGDGNDTLDGGKGIDTLTGGSGDDIYRLDKTADILIENADEGTDTVETGSNYTLIANIENLTLTGKGAINGTGNTGDNTLTGNTGANVLDGGTGVDTLIGGKGKDTYIVDNAGDVVTESDSDTSIDLVKSSISYTLTDNVENLTLTGAGHIDGTGNTLKNTLLGNDGNNILDGDGGVDILKGGNGNDTYYVDLIKSGTTASAKAKLEDTVTEASAPGTDTLNLRTTADLGLTAATTLTLANNLENIDISATGTNLLNITGNATGNLITGNAASNKLDGGLGNDTLTGGLGNDVFIFSKALNATTNVDSIEDFSTAGDSIQLSKSIFKALGAAGSLNADFFFAGTAANDADDHIIFDATTGALYYDADGTGDTVKVQFATVTLTGIGSLESTDFLVA